MSDDTRLTMEEIREQIQIHEPKLVEERILDDEGEYTDEVVEELIINAEVTLGGTAHSKSVLLAPSSPPEIIETASRQLADVLARELATAGSTS